VGLDTRAFRRASDDWREQWVARTNEAGERPVLWGLAVQKLNEPLTLEDAPLFHQDGLSDLPWPGGLVGGMLSEDGGGPSFRGKAYANYVEGVTGRSLFDACDENWEGDIVREVAEKLRAAVDDPPESIPDGYPGPWMPESREEREALARWFEVCVENDLMVSGDY
jgi:hypothetical protein